MNDLLWTQVVGGAIAILISAAFIGIVKWVLEMKRNIDVLFERHNELAKRYSEMEQRRDETCRTHMRILERQQATLHRLDLNIVRLCEKSGADYREDPNE